MLSAMLVISRSRCVMASRDIPPDACSCADSWIDEVAKVSLLCGRSKGVNQFVCESRLEMFLQEATHQLKIIIDRVV